MENYLEWMATPHFDTQKNRQVAVELSQYFRGYTLAPVYTVENAENATVNINENWARIQPALDFTGIVYIDFKVIDSQGDSMIRRIGIRVTQ
jgi:hypothetical protein